MSTLRQIEANRRNAQKSTGPTSVTGKAVSSMNAPKTGIHAKSLVLPSEKLADLEQLIEEYYNHHQPASPEARLLLDDLINCEWTLRRLHAAEAQAWKHQDSNSYRGPEKYPLGKSAGHPTRRTPDPKPLIPNPFPTNWLRCVNPHIRPAQPPLPSHTPPALALARIAGTMVR